MTATTIILTTHVVYLAISIVLTIWVARTLSTNGLVFLIQSFAGNDELARSVNHLLVVGFYLLNMGYVTLALRYGTRPHDWVSAIEFLSSKVGLVLLVLGATHVFNMTLINRFGGGFSRLVRREDEDVPAHNPTATES